MWPRLFLASLSTSSSDFIVAQARVLLSPCLERQTWAQTSQSRLPLAIAPTIATKISPHTEYTICKQKRERTYKSSVGTNDFLNSRNLLIRRSDLDTPSEKSVRDDNAFGISLFSLERCGDCKSSQKGGNGNGELHIEDAEAMGRTGRVRVNEGFGVSGLVKTAVGEKKEWLGLISKKKPPKRLGTSRASEYIWAEGCWRVSISPYISMWVLRCWDKINYAGRHTRPSVAHHDY